MAELKIYLSKGLNDKFRRIAMSVYGYGRGSLSKAAEEAFSKWCADQDKIQELSKTGQDEVAKSTAVAESHIDPDERKRPAPEAKLHTDSGNES